jgi:NhaC family Na+:H+ antiporter
MSATLGVSALAYLPFAFMNLINPLVSFFYGVTGITMAPLDEEGKAELAAMDAGTDGSESAS